MKTKLFFGILAVLLVFVLPLTGCDSGSTDEEPTDPSGPTEPSGPTGPSTPGGGLPPAGTGGYTPPGGTTPLTGTVAINNTAPEVGDTLTATYTPGNGSGTATWVWLANDVAITGANATTYLVDIAGSVSIDITAPAPGDTLTASYTGGAVGSPTWQWLADGAAIVGATNITYTVAAGDLGKKFSVVVYYDDCSGILTSAETAAAAPRIYIITFSTPNFTATRNGATVGTPDPTVQNVIDDIRTDAGSLACEIQFGTGGVPLDIGANSASFTGAWGAVTLSGKITGNDPGTASGTIRIDANISVTSTADIENTNTGGRALYHHSTGALNISGGTVSALGSTGIAIQNFTTGTVNISGGMVSATTGRAVYSGSTGKITVYGSAVLTSGNTSTTQGTIHIAGTGPGLQFEMTGGTVQNTSTGAIGNAIYIVAGSAADITYSGGTISTAASTGNWAVNLNGCVGTVTPGATIVGNVNP
jgi:hypothetical protein